MTFLPFLLVSSPRSPLHDRLHDRTHKLRRTIASEQRYPAREPDARPCTCHCTRATCRVYECKRSRLQRRLHPCHPLPPTKRRPQACAFQGAPLTLREAQPSYSHPYSHPYNTQSPDGHPLVLRTGSMHIAVPSMVPSVH